MSPLQPTDLHLAFIDAKPSASALNSAHALIEAEIQSAPDLPIHPSIPALRDIQFTDAVKEAHTRLETDARETVPTAIDLSRYEALDPPDNASDVETWRAALKRAYTAHEYLRTREIDLSLLETYGKNAWLVGNARLEDELKTLEREIETAKVEKERVEQARRAAQENAKGEMDTLEAQWREGVSRMLETQAAAEGLRQAVLDAKRSRAG